MLKWATIFFLKKKLWNIESRKLGPVLTPMVEHWSPFVLFSTLLKWIFLNPHYLWAFEQNQYNDNVCSKSLATLSLTWDLHFPLFDDLWQARITSKIKILLKHFPPLNVSFIVLFFPPHSLSIIPLCPKPLSSLSSLLSAPTPLTPLYSFN